MDNVKCANCQHEISRKAKACPACGHPNRPANHLAGWEVTGIFALVVILLWWLAGRDGEEPSVAVAEVPSPVVTAPITPVSSSPPAANPTNNAKARELAATMLNLNGLLCAEVVSLQPLKVRPEVHEVTCVEYRGGSAVKTYHLDTKTGKAWPS